MFFTLTTLRTECDHCTKHLPNDTATLVTRTMIPKQITKRTKLSFRPVDKRWHMMTQLTKKMDGGTHRLSIWDTKHPHAHKIEWQTKYFGICSFFKIFVLKCGHTCRLIHLDWATAEIDENQYLQSLLKGVKPWHFLPGTVIHVLTNHPIRYGDQKQRCDDKNGDLQH